MHFTGIKKQIPLEESSLRASNERRHAIDYGECAIEKAGWFGEPPLAVAVLLAYTQDGIAGIKSICADPLGGSRCVRSVDWSGASEK